MSETKLAVIDGETLMDMRLPPTRFCVQTLLPQGVTVLGGAPKIGKSWLVLDLCVRIAKGEAVWGMPPRRAQHSTSVWRIPFAGCRNDCAASPMKSPPTPNSPPAPTHSPMVSVIRYVSL